MQPAFSLESPVADGRAIVSVPLDPVLTPGSMLSGGDLVQVVRVGGEQSSGQPKELTQALVMSVSAPTTDDLGAAAASVTLLVPEEAAAVVVDASGAGAAGLVLLEHGQPLEVELEVAE